MAGRPYDLVKKALEVDPDHQKSLWLAATATYQLKDYPATLKHYERLKLQFPKGSDNYKQMLRNIAEVKELMGQPIDDIVAELQETPPTAAGGASAATGVASVNGVVSLDSSLTGRVAPTDTVFVFARAASGPRMPLAILRKQVQDLPITFTLDDSMAMNPQMKLSAFPQVVVGARISKSGNAMPQSGDLKGNVGPVAVGASNLQILIDSAVP
jgi:cytochrome c-type biogenesis protein CcmH